MFFFLSLTATYIHTMVFGDVDNSTTCLNVATLPSQLWKHLSIITELLLFYLIYLMYLWKQFVEPNVNGHLKRWKEEKFLQHSTKWTLRRRSGEMFGCMDTNSYGFLRTVSNKYFTEDKPEVGLLFCRTLPQCSRNCLLTCRCGPWLAFKCRPSTDLNDILR